MRCDVPELPPFVSLHHLSFLDAKYLNPRDREGFAFGLWALVGISGDECCV